MKVERWTNTNKKHNLSTQKRILNNYDEKIRNLLNVHSVNLWSATIVHVTYNVKKSNKWFCQRSKL